MKLENQQIVEYDQVLQQFYFLRLLSQLKHLNQMMQVKVPEINSISTKIEKELERPVLNNISLLEVWETQFFWFQSQSRKNDDKIYLS